MNTSAAATSGVRARRRNDVWNTRRFRIACLVSLGLALAAPAVLGAYGLLVAVQALIFGLFALSFDLLIGRSGLVSFGHAAFFGAGAYTVGVCLSTWGVPAPWALLLSMGVATVIALVVGLVSVRTKGIYFAILTLAFAEVLYRLAFSSDAVGGSDGIIGLQRPVLHLGPLVLDLSSDRTFYFLVVAILVLAMAATLALVRSPFGHALAAMRENEERLSYVGFHLRSMKLTVLCLSAALAGLAGGLFALFKGFAAPEMLQFLLSGQVIVMTLVGGMGTLLGPVLAGILLVVFVQVVSSVTQTYNIVVGLAFIAVVLFRPEGLFGFLTRGRDE